MAIQFRLSVKRVGAWNGPYHVPANFERIGLSHVRTTLGDSADSNAFHRHG